MMLLVPHNFPFLDMFQDLLMKEVNIFYHLLNNGNAVLLLRIHFSYQLSAS